MIDGKWQVSVSSNSSQNTDFLKGKPAPRKVLYASNHLWSSHHFGKYRATTSIRVRAIWEITSGSGNSRNCNQLQPNQDRPVHELSSDTIIFSLLLLYSLCFTCCPVLHGKFCCVSSDFLLVHRNVSSFRVLLSCFEKAVI